MLSQNQQRALKAILSHEADPIKRSRALQLERKGLLVIKREWSDAEGRWAEVELTDLGRQTADHLTLYDG